MSKVGIAHPTENEVFSDFSDRVDYSVSRTHEVHLTFNFLLLTRRLLTPKTRKLCTSQAWELLYHLN